MAYKGRISISEAVHLPNRMFHGLYVAAMRKLSTEEGAEALASEHVMDAIEEGVP